MDRITPTGQVVDIFLEAFGDSSPGAVMEKNVTIEGDELIVSGERYNLRGYDRVYVAGTGTAAFDMTAYLEELLGISRISQGIILVPPGFKGKLKKVRIDEVTSPLLDKASRNSLADLLFILDSAGEEDLIILLLSKGTAEILEQLHEGISFRNYNLLINKLKESGAGKEEINSIMMHMSTLKGGQFTAFTHPASMIVLILSDQPGGVPENTFLSPTMADPSTFASCREALIRHKIPLVVPPEILNHFNRGLQKQISETLKEGDIRLSRIYNYVIHDCAKFAADAVLAAGKRDITSTILSTHLEGSPRGLGRFFGSILKDLAKFGLPLDPPCAFIASGRLENSDNDRLEKNCALALYTAMEIEGLNRTSFLAGSSFQLDDTGHTAALVNGRTFEKIKKAGINPVKIIADKKVSKTFEDLGLLLKGSYNPNDSGDIFIMAVE